MAYLDMTGMEDVEATEIVDMANVQPSPADPEIVDWSQPTAPVVPAEVVDFGRMAPQRRKQAMPGQMPGMHPAMRGLGAAAAMPRKAAFVQQVQMLLARMGYRVAASGKWDPATAAAFHSAMTR